MNYAILDQSLESRANLDEIEGSVRPVDIIDWRFDGDECWPCVFRRSGLDSPGSKVGRVERSTNRA